MISQLGPNHHDSCLQPNGKLIFALKSQFQSYKKEDPLPNCIQPISVELIKLALQAYHTSNMHKNMCIADMIIIGFSSLCCPGEHTVTFDNEPIKLLNIQVYQDDKLYPNSPPGFYMWMTFLPWPLTHKIRQFEMQVHCPQMFHLCNTLPLAVALQLAHINSHKAKPHQLLHSYYHTAS